MRRFALLLAITLSLCGCSRLPAGQPKSPLPEHSGNYEASANISYRELQATATLSQKSPDACYVSFTSPDSIKDMAFVFHRDSVDVSYKGLGFQFDPGSIPGGAIAKVMVSAINKSMKDDGVSLSLTDAGMELAGILEVGEFILRLDAREGNLIKLSVPSEELEIEFLNFRFLD